METPETTYRLQVALLHLAEDASDLANYPQVNERALRDQIERIGGTCAQIAGSAVRRLPRGIADDLIHLRTVLRSAATVDDPLSDERSFQARQVSRAIRALRASVQDALEAAYDLGLVPSDEGGPIAAPIIHRSQLKAGWTDSILKRLDDVIAKLSELHHESDDAAAPSAQQKSLLIYLRERVQGQVGLAALLVSIGPTINLSALAHVIDNLGSVARDFQFTIRGMANKISRIVHDKAQAFGKTIKRVASGTKSLIKVLRKRAVAATAPGGFPPKLAGDSDKSQVMIAYARQDLGEARRLAEFLRANGVTVWWDQDLFVGDEWGHVIELNIRRSVAIIPIWTLQSIHSQYVLAEAKSASDRGIKVLPVRSAELAPELIPAPFHLLHTITLEDHISILKAVRELQSQLERQQSAKENTQSSGMRNQKTRLPVVLVLDTSGSMAGTKIDELNKGIYEFASTIRGTYEMAAALDIAVVTFSSSVEVINEFIPGDKFQPRPIHAHGATSMGNAVLKAIDLIRERSMAYRSQGIKYYRPWLWLMSDGEPTDDWEHAAEVAQQAERRKELKMFTVAIGQDCNIDILKRFSDSKPISISGLKFSRMFMWLSSSLESILRSENSDVSLPPVSWIANQ